MKKTYREMATESREESGRAPKLKMEHFTKEEVRSALENNKRFSSACIELGLMRKGSKSPFNAIRNLHKVLDHFGLRTSMLGKNLKDGKRITCPHCEKKFKINLEL